MFVLWRYHGEELQIGTATVRILETRTNRVRLGITAPRDVPIRRPELDGNAEPPSLQDRLNSAVQLLTLLLEERPGMVGGVVDQLRQAFPTGGNDDVSD